MHVDDTRDWFEEYVRVFEGCGRGASDDISRLRDYYGMPLLMGNHAGIKRRPPAA